LNIAEHKQLGDLLSEMMAKGLFRRSSGHLFQYTLSDVSNMIGVNPSVLKDKTVVSVCCQIGISVYVLLSSSNDECLICAECEAADKIIKAHL
jgi:hypothetical protein